jgi:UDP-arabinose 4-epimerase
MQPAVLVTGGAGYIGSHACKALAHASYTPVTIDNLCIGRRESVRWGPLIEADIRDTAGLIKIIREYDIVGVMHFAAFAQVGESVMRPLEYYENNVLGTLSVVAAMRQTGLRKILFSSTCSVYGSPQQPLISETTPTEPVNPFGRSKLMCETILNDYARACGLEHIVLRYFNASGAAPGAGIGEGLTAQRLIPRAIFALLGHIDDFVVNGSDFPTPDGTAIRDYIHVSDLADAHVIALRHLLDGHPGRCVNLGTGRGYSVKEVLATLSHVSGRPTQAPSGPRRAGDPAELVADASLAQRLLGFLPKRSDLRTIVADAWQWHIQFMPASA